MKKINLDEYFTVDKDENIELLNTKIMSNLTTILKGNIMLVTSSGLRIESDIKKCILLYFFKDTNQKKNDFNNIILKSSRIDFGFKKKIFLDLITESNLLNQTEKNDLDKNLAYVGRIRNMLIHGNHIFKDNSMHVHYYEGGNKIKELNSAYWDEVEKRFKEVFQLMPNIINKFSEINN